MACAYYSSSSSSFPFTTSTFPCNARVRRFPRMKASNHGFLEPSPWSRIKQVHILFYSRFKMSFLSCLFHISTIHFNIPTLRRPLITRFFFQHGHTTSVYQHETKHENPERVIALLNCVIINCILKINTIIISHFNLFTLHDFFISIT